MTLEVPHPPERCLWLQLSPNVSEVQSAQEEAQRTGKTALVKMLRVDGWGHRHTAWMTAEGQLYRTYT